MDDINIPEPYKALHKLSRLNRELFDASTQVGCFYCQRVFPKDWIREWTDKETTPICPYCGIDSLLPFDAILKKMRDEWFAVAE